MTSLTTRTANRDLPPRDVPAAEAAYANLKELPTEKLREQLGRTLKLTAEHLLRLALIVRILEERGEDLSDLRLGLLSHLRRIAYGQVLPEVVVRFAGSPALVQRISNLPLPDQERLAQGEPVKLVTVGADGQADHLLVDPLNMSMPQLAQVFAPDRLRGEAEQLALLQRRAALPAVRARQPKRGKVRIDREQGGLMVGRVFVPLATVLDALAELRDNLPADEEEEKQVPVRLSEREHIQLKDLAAKNGCTLTALIRRAMYAAGLLKFE